MYLYAASILLATITSLTTGPYSELAPKKVFLQHLHEHDSMGTITRSVMAVGAVDSVSVDLLLKEHTADAPAKSGWEWQVG